MATMGACCNGFGRVDISVNFARENSCAMPLNNWRCRRDSPQKSKTHGQMKTTFQFQMQNVFIFQPKSRCRNSKRASDTSTCDTFDPRLPTLDSDTKIDFRQCRSVGIPTPVSERPALAVSSSHRWLSRSRLDLNS